MDKTKTLPKMKWINQTKLNITKKEQLIKESKKYLMLGEGEVMVELKEMNKKQTWFNLEKKKP